MYFLHASPQNLWFGYILGDPGAVSREDGMFVVKVYCKIETNPEDTDSYPVAIYGLI